MLKWMFPFCVAPPGLEHHFATYPALRLRMRSPQTGLTHFAPPALAATAFAYFRFPRRGVAPPGPAVQGRDSPGFLVTAGRGGLARRAKGIRSGKNPIQGNL